MIRKCIYIDELTLKQVKELALKNGVSESLIFRIAVAKLYKLQQKKLGGKKNESK